MENNWISIKDKLPNCEDVLGYNEKWIDEDFNPKGTRICTFVPDFGWSCAKWNASQDAYFNVSYMEDDRLPEEYTPTHWIELPDFRYYSQQAGIRTEKKEIKPTIEGDDKSFIVCDCDRPEIEDNNLCKRCGSYNRNGF